MNIHRLRTADLAIFFCSLQLLSFLATKLAYFPIVAASSLYIPINLLFIFFIYRHKLNIVDIVITGSCLSLFIIFTALSPLEYESKFSYLILGFNAFLISILFKGIFAYKIMFIINYLVNITVFMFAMKSGFDPRFADSFFHGSSRNIVSAYLIIAICYYLFLCYTENKKINFLLIFLFTINCILLYGRSGVILSILILAYTLYKTLGKVLLTIVVSTVAIFIGVIYEYLLMSTKLSQGALNTSRTDLYTEYLSSMSLTELFFGRSIMECCSLIVSYGGNPHNSFIQGHMNHGIFHTIFFLTAMTIILYTRIYELIFLVTVLYIRYSIDWIGLFSTYDVVIFSIFIYCYKSLKTNKVPPHKTITLKSRN